MSRYYKVLGEVEEERKMFMRKASKVLMLVENLPVPADPRVWAAATTLRDAGFQVSIICPKGPIKDQEAYICIDRISIYRYQLPASSNKFTSYFAEFGTALFKTFWLSWKVLLRHGFDVIHAANPPDLFFELCSYQVAHYVIVTNLSQKSNATQRGRCSPGKVFVVRNGPDLKRLKPVAPEADLKRGRRYLLAYIGVMGQQDGVEYALHALHELVHKRGRQDVALVLMGDGDHAAILRRLAHELELDSYVNFTGWAKSKDIV